MEDIYLESSDYTPRVVLNRTDNIIEFTGKSYPSNTFEFFDPIMKWLKEYIKISQDEVTVVKFNLIYINSSTNQVLFEIFDLFYEEKRENLKIIFFNDHDEDDYEEDELFEDLSEEFPDLDIQLVRG